MIDYQKQQRSILGLNDSTSTPGDIHHSFTSGYSPSARNDPTIRRLMEHKQVDEELKKFESQFKRSGDLKTQKDL